LHHGSFIVDAVGGAGCASLPLEAPTKASIRLVATDKDRSRRIINLPE
jgi:hypothetical protein